MVGQPELKVDLKKLATNALVTDLVYNPLETDILKNAKQLGFRTVDGLGMLLYQAELGFNNWFNIKPEVNKELRKFMLNKKSNYE